MTLTRDPNSRADWTNEQTAHLTRLFGEGLTYSQIARVMGVTRSTIAGKCGRLGLRRDPIVRRRSAPVEPRRVTPPKAKPKRKAPLGISKVKPSKVAAEPTKPVKPKNYAGDKARKTLLELAPRGECRYPVGDPKKPGFGFCALPTDPDETYCPEHKARCMEPLATRIARRKAAERSKL